MPKETGQQKKAGKAETRVLSSEEETEKIKNKDRKVIENLLIGLLNKDWTVENMKSHEIMRERLVLQEI